MFLKLQTLIVSIMKRRFLTLIVCFALLSACSPAAFEKYGPLLPLTGGAQMDASAKVPAFDHIALIILENEQFDTVIGSSEMPVLNSLAEKNVLLTRYYAIRHPSLPNYLALVGGDTFGIKKDCIDCYLSDPNLADLIEASGRTWKTYQEDMPSPCFAGDAHPYVQKHNPFMYFDKIRLDADRCNRSVVPLTELDKDLSANQLPNFSFIMPTICNSGHDCSLSVADAWVGAMVKKL